MFIFPIGMPNLVITIMAAGEGKRMNSPLPKVLHLFRGEPMLVRIIKTCVALCPKKIIIVTGKHDELIKETLLAYIDISVLIFIQQVSPIGTGDAIRSCLPFYESGERVLILNGDMPLITRELLDEFVQHNRFFEISILVAKFGEPKGYGRILYDEDRRFISIIEEKDCDEDQREIQTINSGVYMVSAELLKTYVPIIDNKNAQNEYYLTDIVKIVKDHIDLHIETYLVDPEYNHLIAGVNTQEELVGLELESEVL